MTQRPSFITMPGKPHAARSVVVPCTAERLKITLPAGLSLLAAARQAAHAAGGTSAVFQMQGGAFGPFSYVMPALAMTPDHAAFYSETFSPPGVTQLTSGALTLGTRDGADFFHCHGLWTEASGRFNGGHMMPDATIIAEPIAAEMTVLHGATFTGTQDSETGFKLFEPTAAPAQAGKGKQAFALRLRPNQDFTTALEAFCAEKGLRHARIGGGVGSVIGIKYDDGREIPDFATEVYVIEGEITPIAGGSLKAAVRFGHVDYRGNRSEGWISRGENPVLMTFELVIEEA